MQKVAKGCIIIGILILVGFGFYQVVSALLLEAPKIIAFSLSLILVGLVLAIISLIYERIKGGDDEDVHRKY